MSVLTKLEFLPVESPIWLHGGPCQLDTGQLWDPVFALILFTQLQDGLVEGRRRRCSAWDRALRGSSSLQSVPIVHRAEAPHHPDGQPHQGDAQIPPPSLPSQIQAHHDVGKRQQQHQPPRSVVIVVPEPPAAETQPFREHNRVIRQSSKSASLESGRLACCMPVGFRWRDADQCF